MSEPEKMHRIVLQLIAAKFKAPQTGKSRLTEMLRAGKAPATRKGKWRKA